MLRVATGFSSSVPAGRSAPTGWQWPVAQSPAARRDTLGAVLQRAVLARQMEPDEDGESLEPEPEDSLDEAMSTAEASELGRDALDTTGYEELIRLAIDAGLLTTTGDDGNGDGAVLQRAATGRVLARQEAEAVTFGAVFTRYAIAAGVASQLDSPAPGPGDVVALGILAAGLIAAGYAVLSRPACPPCPPNPPIEIDRVPPSAQHFPCLGDHWHLRQYNQNPTTCQCFLSGRLFGGCCGVPGAPC